MVARAFGRVKPRKAPGADGIGHMALRCMPPRTVAAYARLFNGIMRTGHFPASWKEGRIIMILKKGKNPQRPESYRPITLLPAISKVFERLLLSHITPHFTPRCEQFGFRSELSTPLQLTRIMHRITAACYKRHFTCAVLLDMEKAFDKVWHQGLLFKLLNTQIPRKVIRVVASFLENRSFHVTTNGVSSNSHPIAAGVPQGSCLSPTLYSCFTDDIPLAERDVELALYADDAAFFADSRSPKQAAVYMQRQLDLLPAWLENWRLQVNVLKTQAIIIRDRGSKSRYSRVLPPPLTLCGQPIQWVNTVKYLGITIDRKLSARPHVRLTRAKAAVARHKLRPIFQSNLPLKTKLLIYKTYVRPILTYAAQSWYALCTDTHKSQLEAQQNYALRTITRAPRYTRTSTLLRDLKIESLGDHIAKLSTRMFERADTSDHPSLRNLATLHSRPPDPKLRHPRDLCKSDPQAALSAA